AVTDRRKGDQGEVREQGMKPGPFRGERPEVLPDVERTGPERLHQAVQVAEGQAEQQVATEGAVDVVGRYLRVREDGPQDREDRVAEEEGGQEVEQHAGKAGPHARQEKARQASRERGDAKHQGRESRLPALEEDEEGDEEDDHQKDVVEQREEG